MDHSLECITIKPTSGHRLNEITAEEIGELNGPKNNLFRSCSLVALNAGNKNGIAHVEREHKKFGIKLHRDDKGVHILLDHPPKSAIKVVRGKPQVMGIFVDHLRSIAGDLLAHPKLFHSTQPKDITDGIRGLLQNNDILEGTQLNGYTLTRLTCQGGQCISDQEYYHYKEVGREAGFQGYEIITGGGNGSMRAPFSGAAAGHRAQCIENAKMIGLTCPDIIANEPPNDAVRPVITFPDMEKRLEAFVRMAMGTVIGPGGVGTIEEILYLMAILLDPRNKEHATAIVLSGPEHQFFDLLGSFIRESLGEEVWNVFRSKVTIVVNDPQKSVDELTHAIDSPKGVREFRSAMGMSELWDELITIHPDLQIPFVPSHESVAVLRLNRNQSPQQLIIELRKAISAIVWATVTEKGNAAVRNEPLRIHGEQRITRALEHLLASFTAQKRWNLRDPEKALHAYQFVHK